VRRALFKAVAAAVSVAAAIAFQPPQPHFIDVTARSKFAYITNNDLSPRKYFVQPMAGGVAIFDYDNDGRMDIFFTNGAEEDRPGVL
jgi:enediyne biosynthesis protein E4